MIRCEHQDGLLMLYSLQVHGPGQEQRETVCSLKVDCDQVSLVGPCEVERVYDVNGYTRSLGVWKPRDFL